MDTKIFNTRFQLKYDTWANWSDENKQFKLLQGEVAIVYVPESAGANGVLHEPAVLFKVGDGVKTFNQLPFVSALAGDVPAWAKVTKDDNDIELSDQAFINALKDIEGIKALLSDEDLGEGATSIAGRIAALEEQFSDLDTAIKDQNTTIQNTINTSLTSYDNRLKTIEEDYLTSEDLGNIGEKFEQLSTNLTEAKNRIDTFLDTEGVADTVDTLHDIKAWMEGPGVDATELTTAIAGETAAREAAIAGETAAREAAIAGEAAAREAAITNLGLSLETLKTTILNEAASTADDKIEDFGDTLAPVATSGILEDLGQENEYVIFNCGSATTLISDPIKT